MLVAIDAGGTSTRAVALDATGRALGHGRAGAGNPTAVGVDAAVAAIAAATRSAVGPAADADLALVAMAGEKTSAFVAALTARLGTLGVRRVLPHHDLLAVFHSGTPATSGYALVAGTGSVAARVRDGELDRVVGGRGWLLGDAGSGFWVGQQVARAVVSALDGQARATALTRPTLATVGVAVDPDADPREALRRLVSALYARPPVGLAALAPLAFAAYGADPVASGIVDAGVAALADLLDTVRTPDLDGPVVAGGSVLVGGYLGGAVRADRLVAAAGETVATVPDGLVGAAVLALRTAGVEVDAALFDRLRTEVNRVAG